MSIPKMPDSGVETIAMISVSRTDLRPTEKTYCRCSSVAV